MQGVDFLPGEMPRPLRPTALLKPRMELQLRANNNKGVMLNQGLQVQMETPAIITTTTRSRYDICV